LADSESLLKAWNRLVHEFGYALHHIEEFEPSKQLQQQFAGMGSCLRVGGRWRFLHHDQVTGKGGFGEVGASEDEIKTLCHGLTDEQLALICCKILDGYSLEGAFNEIGITVLSPIGKAMATGLEPIEIHRREGWLKQQ
jgi:hypothetical protein